MAKTASTMAAQPTYPRISIGFQSPKRSPPAQVPRTSGATTVRAAPRGRWTPPLWRSAITVDRLVDEGHDLHGAEPDPEHEPAHRREESPDGPAQVGAVQDPDPDEGIGPGEGQSRTG